jgi:hypothetical protein
MKLDNKLETEIKKKTLAVVGDVASTFSILQLRAMIARWNPALAIHAVTKYAYDEEPPEFSDGYRQPRRSLRLYGIHGDDCWAEILLDRLGSYGIGTEGFRHREHSTTPVYHKVYDENITELP